MADARPAAPPLPRLYEELASWWPLLSAPEDYADEADGYRAILVEASRRTVRTVLELGCGGGNNASHLKAHFEMTLSDRSPGMLDVSRALNPECRHVEGDMRDLRLGQRFDAVLIHDAVSYLTTEEDLRLAMETARVHCEPGGAALFAPDYVRESFRPSTDHGGHDGEGRGLRYLEWTWDPDPMDTTYVLDFAYLMREGAAEARVEQDRHVLGLFGREDWFRLLADAGFEAHNLRTSNEERDPATQELFLGVRAEKTEAV